MTTISPVSRPWETTTVAWIEAQQLDVAQRDGELRRIDDPDGRLVVELGQRGGWNLDHLVRVELQRAVHGGAEPHRRRRIGQADLDLRMFASPDRPAARPRAHGRSSSRWDRPSG